MSPHEVLHRLREHADAPRWRVSATDKLVAEDHLALDALREALALHHAARGDETHRDVPHDEVAGAAPSTAGKATVSATTTASGPAPSIVQRIASLSSRVPSYRQRLPRDLDLERDWGTIATSSREDLAMAVWRQIPDDADLERLIVYRTAGTTGHVLQVPHHPRAAASYLPLLEVALRAHGAGFSADAETVGLFLVGAQVRTVTLATTLSAWGDTGFAKLNLRSGEWPAPGSAGRYFAAMAPRLLTGDPISFSEMLRQEIPATPTAMVSTAVAMSEGLRRRLAQTYGCPVIDWYSLTETGPIGYRCPRGEGYHLLPHDLYVEVLDQDGAPAAAGQRGEITVTGGRNPFLPLLRYRTGDWGRLDPGPCLCGAPTARILDLEGRQPVLMRAADGGVVNPVDLSRVLREFPFVCHELTQHRDLSCQLRVRPVPGTTPDTVAVAVALARLLGGVSIDVRLDEQLGDRREAKLLPYRSELLLED